MEEEHTVWFMGEEWMGIRKDVLKSFTALLQDCFEKLDFPETVAPIVASLLSMVSFQVFPFFCFFENVMLSHFQFSQERGFFSWDTTASKFTCARARVCFQKLLDRSWQDYNKKKAVWRKY